MLDDVRRLPSGSQVDCDLCVIGGGAAGITLTRAFAGARARICLVESGGLDADDACQALYEGETDGLFYPRLDRGRLRYFGGSTNHWTGYCCPFTAAELQPRDWVPFSGWPLAWEDLESYYVAAQRLCEVGRFAYQPHLWPEAGPFPDFLPDKLAARIWQLSPPTRFGTAYQADLGAENIRVLLHANATELLTDEGGRTVTGVALRTLDGKVASVRARYFVLACGGIENARMLLVSDRQRPKGLGNDRDVVGRYFMDHIETGTASGLLTMDAPPPFAGFVADGVAMLPALAVSERAQEAAAILTCAASIEAPRNDHPSGYMALRRTVMALLRGRQSETWDEDVIAVLRDLDGVASGVLHRLTGGPRRMPASKPGMPIIVLARCEQAPDPDNRIILSADRDALGLRKVKLHWRLGEMERRTLRHATRLIGEELGRLRAARIKLADWLAVDDPWPRSMNQGFHHMGTTRMCMDPRLGVVDADCRVHGVDNLFIAGSSVFPTSSYVPPTLTIIALTLRLAAHLRRRLE